MTKYLIRLLQSSHEELQQPLSHIFLHLRVDLPYKDRKAIGTVLNSDNRNTSASSKGK